MVLIFFITLFIVGIIFIAVGFTGKIPILNTPVLNTPSSIERAPSAKEKLRLEKEEKNRQMQTYVNRLARASARLGELQLKRAQYEMDPAFSIDYPSFTDPLASFVITLNQNQKIATRTLDEIKNNDPTYLTDEILDEVETKLDNFDTALSTAINAARSIGWGTTTKEERKLHQKAKNLLDIITNDASADTEKENALRSLSNIIDKLRTDHGRIINQRNFKKAIEEHTELKMLVS